MIVICTTLVTGVKENKVYLRRLVKCDHIDQHPVGLLMDKSTLVRLKCM